MGAIALPAKAIAPMGRSCRAGMDKAGDGHA